MNRIVGSRAAASGMIQPAWLAPETPMRVRSMSDWAERKRAPASTSRAYAWMSGRSRPLRARRRSTAPRRACRAREWRPPAWRRTARSSRAHRASSRRRPCANTTAGCGPAPSGTVSVPASQPAGTAQPDLLLAECDARARDLRVAETAGQRSGRREAQLASSRCAHAGTRSDLVAAGAEARQPAHLAVVEGDPGPARRRGSRSPPACGRRRGRRGRATPPRAGRPRRSRKAPVAPACVTRPDRRRPTQATVEPERRGPPGNGEAHPAARSGRARHRLDRVETGP